MKEEFSLFRFVFSVVFLLIFWLIKKVDYVIDLWPL